MAEEEMDRTESKLSHGLLELRSPDVYSCWGCSFLSQVTSPSIAFSSQYCSYVFTTDAERIHDKSHVILILVPLNYYI